PFAWGLWSLELDHQLLQERQFIVRSLQARLRDGTIIDLPRLEDQDRLTLDLRDSLQGHTVMAIYLAVPRPREFRREPVAPHLRTDRFHVVSEERLDENTRSNPAEIRFRYLNVRLIALPAEQRDPPELAGYSWLKLAQVVKGDDVVGTPQI